MRTPLARGGAPAPSGPPCPASRTRRAQERARRRLPRTGEARAALRPGRGRGFAAVRGLLAAAEVEMKDLKSSLDDVEQLAVDLQDDLKAAKAAAEVAEEARTAAEGRAADDAGAAESAAEETHAAQAMAKELRDRVAHLERDAEVGRDVQLCTAVECSCPPMA